MLRCANCIATANSCTCHTTSEQGHDPQWIVYNDRRCYAHANTATTYKEIRILTKCCIFVCFVQIIQTIRCARNTAVYVLQTMCFTTMQIELTCGTLYIKIYYEYNVIFH